MEREREYRGGKLHVLVATRRQFFQLVANEFLACHLLERDRKLNPVLTSMPDASENGKISRTIISFEKS